MNRSLLLILCLVPCLSNAGGTSWTVPDSSLELALGYRFNFFPSSLLESVFSETMPIRAHGVGLELLSKKQSFLLFLNVQHDFSAIKDGVWVDFEGESKHSEIDLSMTSAEFGLGFDIALPGTPVSLTLGGGIGIGVMMVAGEMTLTQVAKAIFPHPTQTELFGELARRLLNRLRRTAKK